MYTCMYMYVCLSGLCLGGLLYLSFLSVFLKCYAYYFHDIVYMYMYEVQRLSPSLPTPRSSSLASPPAQLLWEEGEEEVGEEGGGEKRRKVEEGEEGEVEELDYDESMEDLDLHPTGSIDEAVGEEGVAHRISVTSDSKPGEGPRGSGSVTCTQAL